MTNGPPVFGRRGVAAASRARPAVPMIPRTRVIVPTSVRGLALAGVGVTAFEFAILTFRAKSAGVADVALGTDPAHMLTSPPSGLVFVLTSFVFVLALGAFQVAALYTLVAHAALRWIGLKSPLDYALGGMGAAYVLLALRTLNGAHVQFGPSLIELAGGALAGALYRYGAGLADAPETNQNWPDEETT
jgi:hypothetical protein